MIEYLSKYPVKAKTVVERPVHPYVELQQVHGKKVILVDASTPSLLEADGMITQEKHVTLMIKHADCQVAIIYDPIQHALGIAHAGWRGQVQSLYTLMIQTMENTFKSDPQNLVVAFAPSLSPAKSEFVNYRSELPEWMWAYEEKTNHFNLWKIAEAELLSCGVKKENVTLPDVCTVQDTRFYSYRRDKTTQRNYTLVSLI